MCRSHLLALVALALCAGVAGGCGGDAPESIGSDDIVRDAARERNQQRIERLEARLSQLKRAPAVKQEAQPGPSASRGGVLAGFDEFAATLNGEVGLAVATRGSRDAATAGAVTGGSAWSTIKVPIALRVLQDAGGPSELDAATRGQIERAITASDNDAAAELFAGLGSRHGGVDDAANAVTEVLRAAGDGSTVVSTQGRDGFSPYGQTEWSLAEQERFMAALVSDCLGNAASVDYLLELMGRVTSDTWGLGSAGVPARWKGGWGPGTDGRYLVRQMGVFDIGGRRLVLSIAARASDGQFASGQALASEVAGWVADRADRLPAAAPAC